MGRWARDRLPVVAGLLLVGVVLLYLWWVFRWLPPADRPTALTALAILLPTVIFVIPQLVQLGRGRRSADSRPVEVLAALLAQDVYGQWRKAADERRLVTPAPIPIRWALSDLDVGGQAAAVVGAPGVSPAFPPLPGCTTITEKDLRTGGGRRELHQLFAGLASGRVVVVGAPGAGKSGAAILLLLDALAHRDGLDDTDRARVPVPVLFTGHGWDPTATSVRDWLRDRLVATYPLFQCRGGEADAAALVGARDKVALILDGLDEMDETMRPATLQALSDAPFRVVALTRSPELVQATSEAWFVEAVAVQLHDIAGPEAADYLQRARTGPPPAGWTELLTQLRHHPDGLLARGLSIPLTLTLLRDTYHGGDDLGDLLDITSDGTAEHIERHLIDRVLPAAYTPRPGRPPPRYSEAQARQALTFLAQRMDQDHTRDLAWWHIPRWASTMPRVFTAGLRNGLAYGLACGLACGLVLGLALILAVGLRDGMIGLGLGSIFGIVVGSMFGTIFGTMGGYMGKPAWGRLSRSKKLEPRRIRIANWRAVVSRKAIGQSLLAGLAAGLGFGFMQGLSSGLVLGLTFGLFSMLVVGFTEGGTAEGRPLGPREIWRNDGATGLLSGLVFGLVLGLVLGLVGMLAGGLKIESGIVAGLIVSALMTVLISAQTITTLSWRQLKLAGHVPAVSLMPFLEDARERGVLRTVGGIYQFRHATLQDLLAGQTTPSSAVSRVS